MDIFISYAHEDEARIHPLALALEQQGWSVFWDRRIPAGQTWRSYIGQNLSDARCVIVAWSRQSVTSKWVVEEADEGLKRDRLVPVLLDSIEPPIGFRSVQAANLTNWRPNQPSPQFQDLVHDIEVLLRPSPMLQPGGVAAPQPPQRRRDPVEVPTRRGRVSWHYFASPIIFGLLALLVLIGLGSYWGYIWLHQGTISPRSLNSGS
jgi:hypothetical protein